jgi:hypothetical protein
LSGQKLAKWIPLLKRGSARYTFQVQSLYFYLPSISNRCLANVVPWQSPRNNPLVPDLQQGIPLAEQRTLFRASPKNCLPLPTCF